MPNQTIKHQDIHKYPSLIAKVFESKKGTRSIIGKELVSKRLRKLSEIAPSGAPIEFTRALLIKKGDLVPNEFREISGIKVDAKGIAQASYSDGWCQSHWDRLGDWENSWGECWDNSTSIPKLNKSVIVINSLSTKIKAFNFSEFTAKELAAISRFGITS